MTRLTNMCKPIDLFREKFAAEFDAADRMVYDVNRQVGDDETFLRLEAYATPTLARLVIEEYMVHTKMHGTVITTYPKVDNEIPIFFCQIGGVGDRSIAVLDISPTTADLDYTPLIPVYEKYRELLGLKPSSTAWLQAICSPYLLHCNYAEMDEELFVEAMVAYYDVWLEHYYRPAVPATSPDRIERITNAVYKFKFQLHHHDPAYGFFAKAWGKPAADAFVDLECGDYPAFLPPKDLDDKIRLWHNEISHVLWTEEAQRTVMAGGEAEQDERRSRVEAAVLADGFGIITPDLLARYASTS